MFLIDEDDDLFASSNEDESGNHRKELTCLVNKECRDNGRKNQNLNSRRRVIFDDDGDDDTENQNNIVDQPSISDIILTSNFKNDCSRPSFNDDGGDSDDASWLSISKFSGEKPSYSTPRFSSKNRINSKHESGKQQRRRRLILDDYDDESIDCDKSQVREKKSYGANNRNLVAPSFQENCEDVLVERLKEVNISCSTPNSLSKSPMCPLGSTPSNKIPETTGAWTLCKDEEYYFLSNRGLLQTEICCDDWPNYQISMELYGKLYDHQKFGVQWLVALYAKGIGGVLGDDMGLGKTFMTLTLLGGLMKAKTIRNALVLCPVSLLRTWENEARKVLITYLRLPSIVISVISSEMDKNKRAYLLEKAMRCSKKRPHLIISTYGLLTSNPSDLTPQHSDEYSYWNYVILDEGHKIKNPSTQVNQACHQIARSSKTARLLLTGTPIQNNLVELWTLFDWATSGKLLGKKSNFLKNYAEPIERGRDKNSNETTLKIAEKANQLLQEKLKVCFLQRLKKDIFSMKLPTKRDLVVWTHLSDVQRSMYEKFVTAGTEVYMLLNGEKKSPLEAITYLKKLCGHPTLVSKRFTGETYDIQGNLENTSIEELLQQSQKLQALSALIAALTNAGHRVLIFSQSTRMLDIIQRVLRKVARMSRIDGSTKERDRQRLVDDFNNPKSKCSCMLLSTKAGGLGLTLTGADRAIIYDPSWNPAEDSQAVDRCYRIGTTKPVTIYRLIAAGTVEERMYEKQVFKEGIRRTLMDSTGAATDRYFCREDLRRLFTLSPVGQCEMLERIRMLNNGKPPTSPTGQAGTLRLLEKHPSIVGLSSHDSLYNGAEIDSQNKCDLPFNGTPAKFHHLNGEKAENYIPLGKQQGVLNKSRRNREKAKIEKKAITANDAIDVDGDQDNIIDLDNSSRGPSIQLTALEEQMEGLLNSLESQTVLTKTEKLSLHKKIAHLARDLGWL